MKRLTIPALAMLLVLGSAAGVLAGGEKCKSAAQAELASEKRCSDSAEDCLSKMAAGIKSKGWLGIETEKDSEGHYRVASVADDSPAGEAGFETGDILLALNGVSLYSKDKAALKEIKSNLSVGSEVSYTVERGGHEKALDATLVEVPQSVMARWIGEHMLDQHAHIEVASS